MNTMNEELKKYRKSLGLTQAQFAELIGYAREKTIADYETKQREIPEFLKTIIKRDIRPLTNARAELFKLYDHIVNLLMRFQTNRDYDKDLPEIEKKEEEEFSGLLNKIFDEIRDISFYQETTNNPFDTNRENKEEIWKQLERGAKPISKDEILNKRKRKE